jgi:cellulose biosynthesis protein BcsQ
MIISLIQTKGGTGKTTVAQCLAYCNTFKKAFDSICLFELDPQGTLNSWHQERQSSGIQDKGVNFVSLPNADQKTLEDKLFQLAEENDVIIFDVPGESVGRFPTKLAAALSTISLIPMRSSTNDEQSFTDNIYPIISSFIENDPEKKNVFYILPTFVHPQTKITTVKEYFKEIMPANVGCLDYFLPTRSVYENFSREGLTLQEHAKMIKNNSRQYGQAKKAMSDIESIAKIVLKLNR